MRHDINHNYYFTTRHNYAKILKPLWLSSGIILYYKYKPNNMFENDCNKKTWLES